TLASNTVLLSSSSLELSLLPFIAASLSALYTLSLHDALPIFAYRGFKEGLRTAVTLGKVIFPVTLIVTILQYTPVLPWLINLIRPAMGWNGLSGEADVQLVLGNA